MKKAISLLEDNPSVQRRYVEIIFESLRNLGYNCEFVKSFEEFDVKRKDDVIVVCISHLNVLRAYIKGYKNIIYWVQGSSPDESFIRNHSYIRKAVISLIEYTALKISRMVFMVSSSMLSFYNNKYHTSFNKKTFIMPCYNSEIDANSFYKQAKYENNTFCYVGGLALWQCFPETVKLYKKIEDSLQNTKLYVFTGEKDLAENILDENDVRNYEVRYVSPSELNEEISKYKFGFILREESPINYVATPTKLSNYLAAGLIPIVTSAVGFFKETLADLKHTVVLSNICDEDPVVKFCEKKINADMVNKEYDTFFKKYYCTEKYVVEISQKIEQLF